MPAMETARVVAAAVSALAAGLGLLVTIPFGPVQRASRKLCRIRETIDAMDEERHAAQRAVLLRQADALACKVAALHRVPTPWSSYIAGTVLLTFIAVGVLSGFRYGFNYEEGPF